MGKEAQFARAEVAPVVAEMLIGTFRTTCLPQLALDLMNRTHHHARQIKGEI
jgi:hypothetical protein